MARAMRACGERNPNAIRVSRRILVLVDSIRPCAHAAVAAVAQQSGGAAVAAGAGSGREAVAAIADQESAGLAVGVRRGPIGAVADQRTVQQRQGGRVDDVE